MYAWYLQLYWLSLAVVVHACLQRRMWTRLSTSEVYTGSRSEEELISRHPIIRGKSVQPIDSCWCRRGEKITGQFLLLPGRRGGMAQQFLRNKHTNKYQFTDWILIFIILCAHSYEHESSSWPIFLWSYGTKRTNSWLEKSALVF